MLKEIPKFVENGCVIVSGGARGIDYEAHMSCLKSGGLTISFLPGCIQNPYPRGSAFMFDKIVKQNGLIVSEFLSAGTSDNTVFFLQASSRIAIAKIVLTFFIFFIF